MHTPDDNPDNRHLLIAISAVIAAGFLLSGMDALGKWLMGAFPTQQVVWARYFFHTLIVGVVYTLREGPGFMRPRKPMLQAIRALTVLCVTFSIYSALRTISLADATAILFFAPVLVTLLAGLFLHERVGIQEWLAVLLGFVGVLFIVRPGFREIDSAMLLALLAAVSLAFYFVLTRALRGKDSEQTTLFHTTVAGAIILSLLIPLWWVPPTPAQWLYLALTGILGASGHFLLVKAFHLVSAPVLSPYLNAQLVAAALYSLVFFDDRLDLGFFVGAGLIVSAGTLVWLHQRLVAIRARRRLFSRG
jgi:drug/metabolite transporter (DMT)-like permease